MNINHNTSIQNQSSTTESNKNLTKELGVFIPSYLDDFPLKASQFRLYAHIARRASNKSKCWESTANIAKHCRISEKVTRRDLKRLVEMHLIEMQSRPGKTTLYTLSPIDSWVRPEQAVVLPQKAVVQESSVAHETKPFSTRKATDKSNKKAKEIQPEVAEVLEVIEAELIEESAKPIEESAAKIASSAQTEKIATRNSRDFNIFGEQRISIQKRLANPFPDGQWMVSEGQLDPSFLDWQAKQYMQKYGITIAQARYNARSCWTNDPAKLSAAWRFYFEESTYALCNLCIRERNGVGSSDAIAAERAQLQKHSRVFANPPEEFDVSDAQKLFEAAQASPPKEILGFVVNYAKSISLPVEPDWDSVAQQCQVSQDEYMQNEQENISEEQQQDTFEEDYQASTQYQSSEEYQAPIESQTPINQPTQAESVKVPDSFLEQIRAIAQRKAMKKSRVQPNLSSLEQLNISLGDPVLRKDSGIAAQARSYSEDEYIVERDSQGYICRILEF